MADGQMFKYSTCCFAKKMKYPCTVMFNINVTNAQQSQDPDEKTVVQISGFL